MKYIFTHKYLYYGLHIFYILFIWRKICIFCWTDPGVEFLINMIIMEEIYFLTPGSKMPRRKEIFIED